MNATYIHAQQNDLLQAVPAERKSIAEQRPFGEGMLAEEAFIARSSLASRQPEGALMCAVLEDAVDCFQKQFVCASPRAKRLGQEAEAWLFSDNSKWAFSFLSICTMLDLGPQYIRRGLKRWRERGPQPRKQPAYVVTAQQAGGLR
jgi:hypothetical protein